jgi:hypothetical protein
LRTSGRARPEPARPDILRRPVSMERCHMSTDEPTQEQVDTYRRDGFLVVEGFVAEDQIERVREHFGRAFAHDW